jgi:two-component system sensor histidine kinase/response regulator
MSLIKPAFYLKSTDSKIQKYFDRILPRNLTLRYILGLATIAVLTLAGQLLIQMSLVRLSSDEKTLRVFGAQLDDSESFYREIIRLQTISREDDFKYQLQTLDKDIIGLIDSHRHMMNLINDQSSGLGFPKKLEPFKDNLNQAFDQLSNVFGRLGNIKYLEDPSLRMNDALVINFIKSENHYRDILSQLIKSFEENSRNTLEYFKRLQMILSFLTLLVLVIEGLYVFRPAVHRVYAAIQSRSDFLSRLSHEIRNPMNSILGMAQLLSKTKPTPQQKNYIKILENSSVGLLEMLNNLLDYSAIESSKLKLEAISTDLYSVVEKTLDLVTTKIQEKGLELTLNIASDVPLKILSDPLRLQQILVNLLSNAAKFTEAGFISYTLKLVSTSEGKKIQFSIADSGIGIEPSKVDSIFESFVQENSSVRRKYGGTGLGLTIAREIVTQMGGDLTVESKKGVGSNFSFTIPCRVDGDLKTLNDYIPIPLTGRKYFLVDRNKMATAYIQSLVEEQGGHISCLSDSRNLTELYQQMTKESYDKVLIDASTLGSNLEDFFLYLKEQKYKMDNICILFRYIHANYLFDLLNNYEVHTFFPKPIKPIEFINYLSGYTVDKDHSLIDDETVLISERRYKILIAEDSADNRTLLQIYLEKHSVDLFFAENGKRAVDLFQQQKFDIVFMDIQMPEMDGITATKLIREYEKSHNLKATPILAFSAHKPQDIFNPGEQVHFNDFVLKPINSNIVKVKLKQYLQFSELNKEENTGTSTPKKEEFDVSDLIPSYLERRTQEIDQMNEYITKNDLKNLVRVGHQLKGSAKSYGFEELGELGNQLEQLAQLEAKMDEIKAVVTKITNKISDYKKTHLN